MLLKRGGKQLKVRHSVILHPIVRATLDAVQLNEEDHLAL